MNNQNIIVNNSNEIYYDLKKSSMIYAQIILNQMKSQNENLVSSTIGNTNSFIRRFIYNFYLFSNSEEMLIFPFKKKFRRARRKRFL